MRRITVTSALNEISTTDQMRNRVVVAGEEGCVVPPAQPLSKGVFGTDV
jgi:hypothetical protein